MRLSQVAVALGVVFLSSMVLADRVITVESMGQVALNPDRVNVQLELWSKAKTAQVTQTNLADIQGKVRKVIEKHKVKSEDVQSQNFNLSLEYEYDQKARRNKLVGYSAVEHLSLSLHNIKDLGPFVDALASIKGNPEAGVTVQNLSWDSSEREKAEAQAAAMAVKKARAQAENLAKAAGVQIKGIQKIHYGQSRGVSPVSEGRVFAMKASLDASPATEFSEGQIQVKSLVTAEFEIK